MTRKLIYIFCTGALLLGVCVWIYLYRSAFPKDNFGPSTEHPKKQIIFQSTGDDGTTPLAVNLMVPAWAEKVEQEKLKGDGITLEVYLKGPNPKAVAYTKYLFGGLKENAYIHRPWFGPKVPILNEYKNVAVYGFFDRSTGAQVSFRATWVAGVRDPEAKVVEAVTDVLDSYRP